ncbi:MAG: ABC transporter permease [Gemmataceae bacterium]|nr:ABC transporter permease [Gemmataceae bacterium]
MRIRDLFSAGLFSLRRQKLRTVLTTLGVTIGIATLVASVAVGLGVRRIIEDGFKKERRLREIFVHPGHDPNEGDELTGVPASALRVDDAMSDARRERVRKKLANEWRNQNTRPAPKPLTPDQLREFAGWEHVVSVEPDLSENARLVFRGQIRQGNCVGFESDPERLRGILEFGRPPREGTNEAIVHEFLLYQLGIRSDEDIRACLGQAMRLEFQGTERKRPELLLSLFDADPTRLSEAELKAMARARDMLPAAIEKLDLSATDKDALMRALGRKRNQDPKEKTHPAVTLEVTIVGVFRDADKKRDGDLFEMLADNLRGDVAIPQGKAEELFSALPVRAERGYARATITVDSDEQLKPVFERLKKEGYHGYSIGLFLQMARRNVLLIGFTMDFVALLALTVACLGIMNTMFTAVLERTRDIGVMKAVGAKDRQILIMFLIEGGMIGLVGGWLGVLVGWVVSFPGDNVALRLIREQDENMVATETVFHYPIWLVLGAPVFAMLVTTLAGILPARRAARIEPVVALRSE